MIGPVIKKGRKYGAGVHIADAGERCLDIVKPKAGLPKYSNRRCSCSAIAATCQSRRQTMDVASDAGARCRFFREKTEDVETSH
jgi:hypothetical protein